MPVGLIIGLVITAVVVLIILWGVGVANKLTVLKQRVNKTLKDIDVQLQRKLDLIPNLVNTVKGYTKHESETLEKIIALRSQYNNSGSKDVKEMKELEKNVNREVASFMVQVEAYPELKANTNFLALQEELQSTEDKLAYARQFYNDTVTMYNTAIALIPQNIIANMLKHTEKELFEVTDKEAANNVKVEF